MQIVYASALLVEGTRIHWTIPDRLARAAKVKRLKKPLLTPPIIFVDDDDPTPQDRWVFEPEYAEALPQDVFIALTDGNLLRGGEKAAELARGLVYEHGPLFEEANQVWFGDPVQA